MKEAGSQSCLPYVPIPTYPNPGGVSGEFCIQTPMLIVDNGGNKGKNGNGESETESARSKKSRPDSQITFSNMIDRTEDINIFD